MNTFSKIISLFLISLAFSCSDNFDGKDGTKTVYFPGSDKIQQVLEYENGKLNGSVREYYRNGVLKSEQLFLNDSPADSAFFYHKNGNIARMQLHKDGQKEGCWTFYNESGKLYKEICYKNNLLNGFYTEYTYRSGRTLKRFRFIEGGKDGKQELFYNNGKPKSITYYKSNRPCLGTEEWYESGEKVDNDFKIKISEDNKVLLENSLKYKITLENSHKDDLVFCISKTDTGNVISPLYPLNRNGDVFSLDFAVGKGHFIMETVKLAAFRKSTMGNTIIKTASINAAAENY